MADLLWLDAVSENMFENDEKVLERDVVGVELPPELDTAVDDLVDIHHTLSLIYIIGSEASL